MKTGKRPVASERIYDSFVEDIVTSRLKGGDRLPTMQQIAEENGVSFRVARGIVERLAHEGYVKSYPHRGTVVLTKDHTVWRGRVAFVLFDDDGASYFVASIVDAARRRFLREGYLFTPIVASRAARGDCSQLKTLLGQRVDFVLLAYPSRHLERIVAKSGVSFAVLFGNGPSRPGVWSLPLDLESQVAVFLRHCEKANVRSLTAVRYAGGDLPPGVANARAAGLDVRELVIEPLANFGRPECIERAAMERFLELPPADFPDVFAFGDDFVAQGALTALLKRQVRIPDDVCVVTVSNRGLGPVHPDSLTRFEWDGAAIGRRVAAFVSGVLAGGRTPSPPSLSPEYVFGKTFPWGMRLHEK